MRRECDICRRLGKQECGYHKFKNQCLERLSRSQIKEREANRTQTTSFNGTSSFIGQLSKHQPLPQEPIHRNNVNVRFQRPATSYQGHVDRQFRAGQGNSQMQEVRREDYQFQSGPVPMENHIMREENGQMMYYPIYPVYEIVYEPVSSNSSFVSDPSRVVYN